MVDSGVYLTKRRASPLFLIVDETWSSKKNIYSEYPGNGRICGFSKTLSDKSLAMCKLQ
jgi:hypothetical protein